jgi:hypothetical protein
MVAEVAVNCKRRLEGWKLLLLLWWVVDPLFRLLPLEDVLDSTIRKYFLGLFLHTLSAAREGVAVVCSVQYSTTAA